MVQVDSSLAPTLRTVTTEAAKKGIKVTWISGYRTLEKQKELYDAWIASGKHGLPASEPGSSYHNYGLAADFVATGGPYSTVGEIAKGEGLRWGGDFTDHPDPVHIDMGRDMTIAQAKALGYPLKLEDV